MKWKSVQTICIILFLVLGTAVTQAGAAFITVDKNGVGNYTSIQEAVNNAQDGDMIVVSPGVYQENIEINKEVGLTSSSALTGTETNRTYVIGAVPDSDVFSISSSNVTVEGFYIEGGPSAVERQEAGIYLDGVQSCSLSNNTLILNDVGILLSGAQKNYVGRNLVSFGSKGISLVNSKANILSNNLIVANSQGILLNNSVNNTLVNNTAGSNAIGIFMGTSQENKLAYNIISKNSYGISGQNAQFNSLFNNSLYLNDIGVDLNESSNNAIYENEFINFLNAVDNGNNIWNSTEAGNYWDNYAGNDTDGNGIGDTPYIVNETTGSMDYMPLINMTFSGSNFEKVNADVHTLIALLNKKYPVNNSESTLEKGVVVEMTELGQINTSLDRSPVFLIIGAEWCQACQSMKPILNELATEYRGKATVIFININKNTQLATYFGVEYIPDSSVIVGIENGKYVYMQEDGNVTTDRLQARIVGVRDKGVFERVLNFALLHEEKNK
jgi:nitrous oxidase accessory protein